MTFRNRIALTFALISSGLLLVVCLFMYFFTARSIQQEFINRLTDRTEIAAQTYLKKDDLSQRIYDEILRKHLATLPQEQEFFIPIDHPDSLEALLPDEITPFFLEDVSTDKYASLYGSRLAAVGIRYDDNQGTYLAIVTAVDESGQKILQKLRLILALIFLLYLAVVFFISRWFAHQTLGPIARIISKMESINASNLHLRLSEGQESQDELVRLVHTFNSMLDRLETSVEAQNQFISNASHELKNPLAAIIGEVELALAHERAPEFYRQSITNIGDEASRLQTLILRLLRLAQATSGSTDSFYAELRIDELLLEVYDEFHELDPTRKIEIDFSRLPSDPQHLVVWGNRPLLRIAITNLVENAFKFSGNEPIVAGLRCERGNLLLWVADKGVGIGESDMPYIFDPFFRAEAIRHLPGFGIGLPMVQKIIRLHKGAIDVRSAVGQGTQVFLQFPNNGTTF